MWNEGRKAAVNTIKSKGCIKASTVIYKRVSFETSIAGNNKVGKAPCSGVTSDNPMTFSPWVQLFIVTEQALHQVVLSQLADLIALKLFLPVNCTQPTLYELHH